MAQRFDRLRVNTCPARGGKRGRTIVRFIRRCCARLASFLVLIRRGSHVTKYLRRSYDYVPDYVAEEVNILGDMLVAANELR